MSQILRIRLNRTAEFRLGLLGGGAIELADSQSRAFHHLFRQHAGRVRRSDERGLCLWVLVERMLAHPAKHDRPVEPRPWLDCAKTLSAEIREGVFGKPLIQLAVRVVGEKAAAGVAAFYH